MQTVLLTVKEKRKKQMQREKGNSTLGILNSEKKKKRAQKDLAGKRPSNCCHPAIVT